MYYTIFRRESVFLVVLVLFFLVILSGCEILEVESWTHVVVAENYTDAGGYSVYRIDDNRFNQNDWYDIWMDNSYWDPAFGWGPFDSVFDSVTDVSTINLYTMRVTWSGTATHRRIYSERLYDSTGKDNHRRYY